MKRLQINTNAENLSEGLGISEERIDEILDIVLGTFVGGVAHIDETDGNRLTDWKEAIERIKPCNEAEYFAIGRAFGGLEASLTNFAHTIKGQIGDKSPLQSPIKEKKQSN